MNSAAVPTQLDDVQGDGRWLSVHKRYVSEVRDSEPDVLLIGDSYIQQLAQTRVWSKYFEPLHCLNFGINGDKTQHVLWRVQHGELEQISPKVVVVCTGTNNYEHTAEEVVDGILEIVKAIGEKQRSAQIIVMSLPPRGQFPNPLRVKNAKINSMLANKLSNQANADGEINHRDMYDYLHLTEQGYQKLCEPLVEEIQNLTKTFVKCESVDDGDN
ncbi:platelet-activating factor acetylhydrolase IB subunit alpha2-like isoform X2 [Tubulanus polymorphus]|uniref:platelet-activating factor acetylhydrolase IB subunit alpha2-like isoform X2 n=1 Tax=Tubulanus polymorphus TaxID=672921 RepID=UPI003DA52400